MKQVRFIHAADLHLGRLFSGFSQMPTQMYKHLCRSGYRAFTRLVDTAIKEQVDFVILAGDIYDVELHNLKAQAFFQKEMVRLSHHEIPVFIVHGNHDFMGGSSFQLAFPSNVSVFAETVENKYLETSTGVSIELVGFSYDKQNIKEKMINQYQKQYLADFHIAILHGNLGNSGQHQYAPFTISDLQEKQFDYYALGHIHKRETISSQPLAIYPGSLVGSTNKEVGEKGFYLISMDESEIKTDFRSVADTIWMRQTIRILELTDFQHLVHQVQMQIKQWVQLDTFILLHLCVDFSECHELNLELLDETQLLEVLQDEDVDEDLSIWIYHLQFITPHQIDEGHFFQEINLLADSLSIVELQEFLSPLINHPRGYRYFDYLDEDEMQNLLTEAKQELFLQWYAK